MIATMRDTRTVAATGSGAPYRPRTSNGSTATTRAGSTIVAPTTGMKSRAWKIACGTSCLTTTFHRMCRSTRSLLGDNFPKLIASEPWLERHIATLRLSIRIHCAKLTMSIFGLLSSSTPPVTWWRKGLNSGDRPSTRMSAKPLHGL